MRQCAKARALHAAHRLVVLTGRTICDGMATFCLQARAQRFEQLRGEQLELMKSPAVVAVAAPQSLAKPAPMPPTNAKPVAKLLSKAKPRSPAKPPSGPKPQAKASPPATPKPTDEDDAGPDPEPSVAPAMAAAGAPVADGQSGGSAAARRPAEVLVGGVVLDSDEEDSGDSGDDELPSASPGIEEDEGLAGPTPEPDCTAATSALRPVGLTASVTQAAAVAAAAAAPPPSRRKTREQRLQEVKAKAQLVVTQATDRLRADDSDDSL